MELITNNKNFRMLWCSQLTSNIGDWLSALAIPLLVYRLTNSPIAISFYMVSRFLPNILFSSFTGVLIDKFNRKTIMIISDLGRFLVFFLYPFTTNEFQIYFLAFISTIFTLLFEPAKNATIPNVVDEKDLLKANSIISSTASFMRLIGTAIGGILIANLSLNVTFYINSVTFIISAFMILNFKINENDRAEESSEQSFTISEEIKLSYRALLRDRMLFTLIFMDALSIIGYGFLNVLLPVFTTAELTKSESSYGLIMSFFSAGIFFGSILINKISKNKSLPFLWCIGLTFSGITQMLFGFSYSVFIAVIFIFMAGFGDAIQIVSYSTIRQKIVPDHLRGRVYSIAEGLNSGALLIGMGSTGFLLSNFSARTLVIYSGIMILISGLVSFIVFEKASIFSKKVEIEQ